jgi:dephospho-CoA kinase
VNIATLPTALKLGLTGGIGSGKSTVARCLQNLGAHVIDADALSRETTQTGGSAMPQIAQTFGSAFVGADGSLDRAKMRERIFSDQQARTQLESIVHTLVARAIRSEVAKSTSKCLVFDVPLLVESDRWRPQLDAVWVVDCSPATQIARVEIRNGWEEGQTRAVIDSQSPRSARAAAADAVLFNEGLSLIELHELVIQLARKFGL